MVINPKRLEAPLQMPCTTDRRVDSALSLCVGNSYTDIPSRLQKNQKRRQENKGTESQPKCPRTTVFEYKIKHCSWASFCAALRMERKPRALMFASEQG